MTHIPAYGDSLEVIWGANWYAEHLRQFSNPFFYDRIFHPTGFSTALQANTSIFLLAMGFFRLFLPEAATYNLFVFASFILAYAGMIMATRSYTDKVWLIALIALLYTYWGMRWVRLGGQVNLLWLSALLPWLFWILQAANRRHRIFGAVLIWALCIITTLYGIWIGALVVGVYFLNKLSMDRFREVMAIILLTILFSLPTLIPFWQAQRLVSSPFYSMEHIVGWGASLNSLPIPAVYHPWLSDFARTIYSGPLDESGVANLGLVAFLAGIAYVLRSRLHDETERFALLLFFVGLIVGLGPLLRWNGRIVEAPLFVPINRALWDLGHLLNPQSFSGSIPPDLANGVPLPGYLLYITVPFLEGSRVVARFAFVAGLGLVLLLAVLLERIKATWLLVALALLLLFERVPWPVQQGVPMPIAPHPAFEELSTESVSLIDLVPSGDLLTLAISGETLYATDLHQRPTASGVSSMWPESTWFLLYWLQRHPRPLQHEEFSTILQGYGVDRILVHMKTEGSWRHLSEEFDPRLNLQTCYDPLEQTSPWPYVICVLQVAEPDEVFTASPKAGWSAPEPWGRWALGTESRAWWAVPVVTDYELLLNAFPNWIDGRTQEVTVLVNDQEVGVLTFAQDTPLNERLHIPADLLNIGWNQVNFLSAYASPPADLTGRTNPDPHPSPFGVSRLVIRPSAAP